MAQLFTALPDDRLLLMTTIWRRKIGRTLPHWTDQEEQNERLAI